MRRLIVPDSCALGAAFFTEACSLNAAPLLHAIRSLEVEVAAPTILMSEFMNICRKKIAGSTTAPPISVDVVNAIMQDFLDLPIIYFPADVQFTREAWELHRINQIGTNDAYFLHLARHFSGQLWTSDALLCQNARQVHSDIFDLNEVCFN